MRPGALTMLCGHPRPALDKGSFYSSPVGIAIAKSGAAITCKCGHADTFDAFMATPVYGLLPAAVFQCPSCKVAIRRVGGGKLQEIAGYL